MLVVMMSSPQNVKKTNASIPDWRAAFARLRRGCGRGRAWRQVRRRRRSFDSEHLLLARSQHRRELRLPLGARVRLALLGDRARRAADVPHHLHHDGHALLHVVVTRGAHHAEETERLCLIGLLEHLRGLPRDLEDARLRHRAHRLEDADDSVAKLAHVVRLEPFDDPIAKPEELLIEREKQQPRLVDMEIVTVDHRHAPPVGGQRPHQSVGHHRPAGAGAQNHDALHARAPTQRAIRHVFRRET